MSKIKCEICGEVKTQQEMSKSYKHRCKECVASLARMNRHVAKSKKLSNVEKTGRNYNDINWEQRRYEIAKTLLPVVIKEYNSAVEMAVVYADRLIDELKKRV